MSDFELVNTGNIYIKKIRRSHSCWKYPYILDSLKW